MEKYNQRGPIGKMLSKKPVKPARYDEPTRLDKIGTKAEPIYGMKKDDPKLAHQAAKLSRWAGHKNASSSDFRK